MFKALLFIAVIWILLTLFRQRKRGDVSAPKTPEPEDMVSCAVCGIHLPRSEAITHQNQHFCCEAHFLQRKQ